MLRLRQAQTLLLQQQNYILQIMIVKTRNCLNVSQKCRRYLFTSETSKDFSTPLFQLRRFYQNETKTIMKRCSFLKISSEQNRLLCLKENHDLLTRHYHVPHNYSMARKNNYTTYCWIYCTRCLYTSSTVTNSLIVSSNQQRVNNNKIHSTHWNTGIQSIGRHQPIRYVSKGTKGHSYHEHLLNPLDRLQEFVAVPIIPPDQISFRPSDAMIQEATQLFIQKHNHVIKFLTSVKFADQLPRHDLPEVAIIGRSNVGKSSLIKIMTSKGTDLVVKTSKTPGQTKMLNFFQFGKKFCIVDVPGYGYRMPANYSENVETFLASRKTLCRTFLLLNGSEGVTEEDVHCINMVEDFQIPYVIVITKIDKARPATLLKNVMSILKYKDQTKLCFPQPFLVSSMTGEGVPLLQTFIANVTGNLNLDRN